MINLELSVKEALYLQSALHFHVRLDSIEFQSERVRNIREVIYKVNSVIEEDRQSKLNELNKIHFLILLNPQFQSICLPKIFFDSLLS